MAQIVVDYREHDLINTLETKSIEYCKTNLIVGDVHIKQGDKNIIIERKTLDDFSSSIVDGRYQQQKHRLLESGAQIIYLIEGCIKNEHGVPLTTLYSAMYTSQVRDNIIVLRSISIEESVKYIEMLCKKIGDVKQSQMRTVLKKSNCIDVYMEMLCCIPGISTQIAKNIIEKFPTLEKLVLYIQEAHTLVDIPKVGTKLSEKIINYIKFNNCDYVKF